MSVQSTSGPLDREKDVRLNPKLKLLLGLEGLSLLQLFYRQRLTVNNSVDFSDRANISGTSACLCKLKQAPCKLQGIGLDPLTGQQPLSLPAHSSVCVCGGGELFSFPVLLSPLAHYRDGGPGSFKCTPKKNNSTKIS